jgi:hypothetical protein
MLLAELKKRMLQAMKSRQTVEKEILRVAIGEIETAAARTGRDATDDEAAAIVKKLVKSNEETLASATDAEQRQTLEQELSILRAYLPQTLSLDQIVVELAGVADQIRAAKSDGQATGVAMKELKMKGVTAEGKEVARAVAQIRA